MSLFCRTFVPILQGEDARNGMIGNRAFYRWIANNYKFLCPNLPERTRLF